MRAATEGSLPPVMPQGNLVEVLGREVRQGSPGELMVESSPSRQRRPPCKTNKEMSDEATDADALTYSLTPRSAPGASLGRAHEGPSARRGGRGQVILCYHKEGPYQDRPLLYPFHHFLSLLWSCFSPGVS